MDVYWLKTGTSRTVDINKNQLIYLISEINDNIHIVNFPIHDIHIININNMKIYLISSKFIRSPI